MRSPRNALGQLRGSEEAGPGPGRLRCHPGWEGKPERSCRQPKAPTLGVRLQGGGTAVPEGARPECLLVLPNPRSESPPSFSTGKGRGRWRQPGPAPRGPAPCPGLCGLPGPVSVPRAWGQRVRPCQPRQPSRIHQAACEESRALRRAPPRKAGTPAGRSPSQGQLLRRPPPHPCREQPRDGSHRSHLSTPVLFLLHSWPWHCRTSVGLLAEAQGPAWGHEATPTPGASQEPQLLPFLQPP